MKLFIILITSLIVLLLLFLVILPLTAHWPFKMGNKEHFKEDSMKDIEFSPGRDSYHLDEIKRRNTKSGKKIESWKFMIKFLKYFIKENNIHSIADLGCGEFIVGKDIYDDIPNITYTGYDIYKKTITNLKTLYYPPKYNFIHLDIFNNKESVKRADIAIIGNIFGHWTPKQVDTFLNYLTTSKKFKYIFLITNKKSQSKMNKKQLTHASHGNWRYYSAKALPISKYNPIILFDMVGADYAQAPPGCEMIDKEMVCTTVSLII